MSSRPTIARRTASRYALGVAAAPWVESFAIVGGHADSGFGLVVVDQGNPGHARGVANVPFAVRF
jgi:hypothetical protein